MSKNASFLCDDVYDGLWAWYGIKPKNDHFRPGGSKDTHIVEFDMEKLVKASAGLRAHTIERVNPKYLFWVAQELKKAVSHIRRLEREVTALKAAK